MQDHIHEFRESLQKAGFSGSILISKNWKIEFVESFGLASMELDVANNNDTIYRIASITKQFTAAAILKLVEEGRISVEDPLDLFLPDFPNGNIIRIHHLLSNTSGVAGFHLEDDFYEALHQEDVTLGLIQMFKDQPLAFEPGTSYDYSNSGYLLLGKIIEIVSGMDYNHYLKKTIFDPLGMHHTMCESHEMIIPGRASLYDFQNGQTINARPIDMRIAGAGGNLLSCVRDLHVWNQALYSYKVLTQSGFDAMIHSHFEIVKSTDYGYGLFLEKMTEEGFPRRRNYHTGGGPGVRSINAIYPDDGLEVIILSNHNHRDIFHTALKEAERFAFSL